MRKVQRLCSEWKLERGDHDAQDAPQSHACSPQSIIYQIVCAVHHAHSNLVLHRDLKPQNILVDKAHGVVKLTDFGLARQYLPPFKAHTEKVRHAELHGCIWPVQIHSMPCARPVNVTKTLAVGYVLNCSVCTVYEWA